jgi:hypothetical protein
MEAIKKFLTTNLIWLITVLVALGGLLMTIKYQGESIAGLEQKTVELFKKTGELKVTDAIVITKLDDIDAGVKEIKSELQGIKLILYKRISNDTRSTADIASSE